ncbi:heparan-alpha-glucosaminide N-acetyltransferase-like [Ischnura elegans]|uniref:heparan-alpha-glucosaminide N-acetyltransferase-like n=1 Tax=Ischnura elegans TaxID=197161 RepID=UPI001ED89D80|nr:heparan-alpha-glucosaminide N-acetyltransferase-like [Ischnura elegans]
MDWDVFPEGNSSFVLNTSNQAEYIYSLVNYTCVLTFPFEEKGIYGLNVTNDACSNVWTIIQPKSQYIPIIFVTLAIALSLIIWKLLKKAWNSNMMSSCHQRNTTRTDLENDLGNVTSPTEGTGPLSSRPRQRERVRALDTFRGISIALMIFVNYGGGGYGIFEHSAWNGLTVADLVFPWFAWIMGVSASLSLRSQLRNTTSRKRLFVRILRRSVLLLLLGVALNTIGGYRNGVYDIRIPGVLQRLCLSYLAVASIEAALMKPQRLAINGIWMCVEDVLECWQQWAIIVGVAVGHVCLTFLLHVPHCPTGYLGPGGLSDLGRNENCTGGAAGYIDRVVLGQRHLYQNPTCHKTYHTKVPYDPEGILGTMNTVLIVFLGVQAGRILMTYGNSLSRMLRWFLWSVITGLAAGFLCSFSKEGGLIPVNKNLWSLSYVLCSASTAFLLLMLLFYAVDVRKWWLGRPFSYAGLNPLLLYVGHCLTKGMFPWFWEPVVNSHAELLSMNVWATALWLLISFCLSHYNLRVSL